MSITQGAPRPGCYIYEENGKWRVHVRTDMGKEYGAAFYDSPEEADEEAKRWGMPIYWYPPTSHKAFGYEIKRSSYDGGKTWT